MSTPRRVNIESFQCQGNYLGSEVRTPGARSLHTAQSEEDTAAVTEARSSAAGWGTFPPCNLCRRRKGWESYLQIRRIPNGEVIQPWDLNLEFLGHNYTR